MTEKKEPVRVILDTDVGGDIDDVGAMAVLHSLADNNEAEILAIGIVNGHSACVPFVHALNKSFGRPDIPVGTIQGYGNHCPRDEYMDPLVLDKTGLLLKDDAPEIVGLYRKILAAQPDKSVTFVVIGQCTNIVALLESEADDASPLSGLELFRQKVCLYAAGGNGNGKLPEGRCGYNYSTDLASARRELELLPPEVPVVFAGGSGFDILVGEALKSMPVDDFSRVSYEAYFNGKASMERPTWDQLRVLYAVRSSCRKHFEVTGPGTISLDSGCMFSWKAGDTGHHSFAYVKDKEVIKKMITDLMLQRSR